MHVMWICGARVVGGAEHVTLRVLEGLQRRGHTCTAMCRPDGALRDELMRRKLECLVKPIGSRSARACYAIAGALGKHVPDIALATTSPDFATAALAPRPTPTRLVLARHMVQPLSRPVAALIAHRADAVIAVSEAVRLSLDSRLPTSLVHVIHNPVRFTPRGEPPAPAEREQARRRLGLDASGRCVGFFGGVHESKGVRDVLDAVRAANQTGETIHLLLCGRSDPRLPPLAALVEERGLQGKVHYIGQIDRMMEAHTAVDVVVMATHTRLGEALPATIAEAMACGTPVLAYATGGMAELIGSDGDAGRLARADDAADLTRVLIAMLQDAPQCAALAQRGLQRIRALGDAEQAVDRYERLFAELVTRD
jgi:glycosyltransferase involved in cell wall biosynthesis